jgi:hypothetical protein
MSKLDEYKTIKERENSFDRTVVTSFDELLKLLKKELKKENVFFRGQAQARWKIFSSIQREWIEKNLEYFHGSIDDFIEKLLLFCQEQLSKEIDTKCKEPYDVSILSMLQHYGAPTPFIDFTSNPDVALYFAVNNNNFIKGDEIDNFFSIYVIEGGVCLNNNLCNFENIISNARQTILEERQSQDMEIATAFQEFPENSLKSINCLSVFSVVYIKESGEEFLKISNRRIDLQNGLFLYQGKNSINPLELHFSGKNADNVPYLNEDENDTNPFDSTSVNKSSNEPELFLPKIKVYDVHKAVLNEANKYLTAKNINKDFLGFGSEDFGKVAFDQYLRKISK